MKVNITREKNVVYWITKMKRAGYSDTYIQSTLYAARSYHQLGIREIADAIDQVQVQTYDCNVSSETLWTNFDSCKVQAYTREHAKELALAEFSQQFAFANKAMFSYGMTISFDPDNIKVERSK